MTGYSSCRCRRAVALAVAAPLLATSIGAGTALAAASRPDAALPSSTALVAATRKAIVAAKSAHFELASTVSGTSERITADTAATAGRQVITSGTSTATLIVLPRFAYFSGNKSGLARFFGMPANDITRVGAKWVSVRAGTTQYTRFKAAVDASLLTGFLPSAKSVQVASATVGSRRGYSLRWTTTSSGRKVSYTLTVAATGPPLPIDDAITSGKDHERTTFSKWGETVKLSAPRSTIAFTKLAG